MWTYEKQIRIWHSDLNCLLVNTLKITSGFLAALSQAYLHLFFFFFVFCCTFPSTSHSSSAKLCRLSTPFPLFSVCSNLTLKYHAHFNPPDWLLASSNDPAPVFGGEAAVSPGPSSARQTHISSVRSKRTQEDSYTT